MINFSISVPFYHLVHPEWAFQSPSNRSFNSHSFQTPGVSSCLFFFLNWPRSQAGALYLVQLMIKSAGLTSASDRPIHPTDTPPPPHTGRLNNLCTILNMKEDLLTLQSPPAPFAISVDCCAGGTASKRVCLRRVVGAGTRRCPAGVWQLRLLLNFQGRKMGRELCNWK